MAPTERGRVDVDVRSLDERTDASDFKLNARGTQRSKGVRTQRSKVRICIYADRRGQAEDAAHRTRIVHEHREAQQRYVC